MIYQGLETAAYAAVAAIGFIKYVSEKRCLTNRAAFDRMWVKPALNVQCFFGKCKWLHFFFGWRIGECADLCLTWGFEKVARQRCVAQAKNSTGFVFH